MHIPFRVLIATQDSQVRHIAENLLKTVQAKCLTAETQDSALAYLGTPEGIDLVVYDSSWEELSVETLYRTCRSRTKVPVETYLVVLVEETNAAGAVLAFNAGADAVLRKNIDPVEFLNACRAGQRLSVLAKMHRVAMEAKATAQAVLAESEQESKAAESASAVLLQQPEVSSASSLLVTAEKAKVAGGDDPVVVRQLEAVARQVLIDQGAVGETCHPEAEDAAAIDGTLPTWAEYVGWQGIFWPPGNLWYDVLFYFSRTGAENICRWMLQRSPRDEGTLLAGINQYMVSLQATYRAHYETGYGPTSTILCQPVALALPSWLQEAGKGDYTRVLKFPSSFIAYNFHIAPAALQVKGAISATPGDVLNETIASRGQRPGPGVMPLANRGVILTEGRLNKIVPELEANRTLWVIEPSLFARRMGAFTAVD